MSLRRLIRTACADERGMALVLALGVLATLSVAGATVITYSSTNQRSARFDATKLPVFSLSEAGIARAMSVLNTPTNNALNPSLLPATRTDYPNGYVIWSGTLDTRSAVWTITSTGFVKNPTGPNMQSHTFKASVPVTPTVTQPLNNPAWNYVYATKPASAGCDETLQQSVSVASPFYVNGNLCLENTSTITSGPLVVKGWLKLSTNNNTVGTASNPINEAHIAGGCYYRNGGLDNPCRGSPDSVYANVLDTSATLVVAPTVYWDAWFLNASPGPYYPCTTVSGTPPTFDTDQGTTPSTTKRNNSVATSFNLTPSASYTCQTAGGELSWNATTRVLTVSGTIFIDGSAYIQNGAVNSYNGQATLYLSGTFMMKNSKLCAGLNAAGTACDFAAWNPNSELLCIVANGSGGQVNSWDGIQLISATYQGALYATKSIDTDTTSAADGPMVGEAINLGQSVTTSFPTITTVPVGMPSNPTVYAQPNPPQLNP